MSNLQHWNGTAVEFWDAVMNADQVILKEVLLLAQERAEMLDRSRRLAAAGFTARMSTFQIQMGVSEEEHAAKEKAYGECCREELRTSRYVPEKEHKP